jgi:sterol desaturase/sphingolipid hydroxylase (fatty acid hydroxylase superfamily)
LILTNAASVAGALLNAAMFIPLSMAWEIVFDFGFYWAHRAVHAWPWLYWFAHKPHHKYQYPTVLAGVCSQTVQSFPILHTMTH